MRAFIVLCPLIAAISAQSAAQKTFCTYVNKKLGVKVPNNSQLNKLATCFAPLLIPCSGMKTDTDRMNYLMGAQGMNCLSNGMGSSGFAKLINAFTKLQSCMDPMKLFTALQKSKSAGVTKIKAILTKFWNQFKTWNTTKPKLTKAKTCDKMMNFGKNNLLPATINTIIKDIITSCELKTKDVNCMKTNGVDFFNFNIYSAIKTAVPAKCTTAG